MIEQVAELADGGFWYVLPAATETDFFGAERTTVDLDAGAGWCAWYGEVAGTLLAAVRTPDPLVGVAVVEGVTPAQAIAASGEGGGVKPFGRVQGG